MDNEDTPAIGQTFSDWDEVEEFMKRYVDCALCILGLFKYHIFWEVGRGRLYPIYNIWTVPCHNFL